MNRDPTLSLMRNRIISLEEENNTLKAKVSELEKALGTKKEEKSLLERNLKENFSRFERFRIKTNCFFGHHSWHVDFDIDKYNKGMKEYRFLSSDYNLNFIRNVRVSCEYCGFLGKEYGEEKYNTSLEMYFELSKAVVEFAEEYEKYRAAPPDYDE